MCSAGAATAQVTAELALQSDYRLRGYSISGERPVAAITIGYDDPSGIYAGGTAVGAIRNGEPGVVSLQGNIGYARRVSSDISLDGGLSRFEYFAPDGPGRDFHYTEIYVGMAFRSVTARVRYSPDYISPGTETIYAELDAGTEFAPDWVASAHLGMLQYLNESPAYLPKRRYDWRLGVSRLIGAYGAHLELSGRRFPRTSTPGYAARRQEADRTGLVFSLTRAF